MISMEKYLNCRGFLLQIKKKYQYGRKNIGKIILNLFACWWFLKEVTFHDVDDFFILLYLFINSFENHADHVNLLDTKIDCCQWI